MKPGTPDPAAWDERCETAFNGNAFHTLRFLGYHPDGRFDWDHAVVPAADPALALWPAARSHDGRTWWSGAGASYGGPVLPTAEPDEARRAVEAVVEEAGRRGYGAVRTTPPPPLYEPGNTGVVRRALADAGFRIVRSEVSQAARLAGPVDEVLRGPARRGARKAERDGVVLDRAPGTAAFHDLLVKDRARIGAEPVHSAAELADLAERLGRRQCVTLARYDGEPVAGAWTLLLNERVAMSFYVCQSWEHRRLRATNLVQRASMEWAAQQGVAVFDFGTSSIGGVLNEGLFAFKEAHGAEPFDRETFEREL